MFGLELLFFFVGEMSLLSLSKKIEGLGWRTGKIDERKGTGDQSEQIKKLRMCDMFGGVESEVKTEKMMGLMTFVDTFPLRVTSEEKTAKSVHSEVCVLQMIHTHTSMTQAYDKKMLSCRN